MDRPSHVSKLILALAILGGVSFLAANRFALPETATIVWKGSGVALLAVYAAMRAKALDGWLLAAVMALADRVAVLDDGKLISLGTPSEVTNDPVVIAAYLGTDDDAEATEQGSVTTQGGAR